MVDWGLLSQSILATVIISVVIMYACNSFEEAADHLGRNMPPGVKGATINAIGSSLPELFTTVFLLFVFHDMDGFSAGIATTAGSAIFNAIIIPAVCILAVMFIGVKQSDGSRKKIKWIEVGKGTIIRDGFFLLLAEIVLILLLGKSTLTYVAGLVLIGVYLLYFAFLMGQFKMYGSSDEIDEDEEEENDDEEKSWLKGLVTLDVNRVVYSGREIGNNMQAWVVLIIATLLIAAACHQLANAVMDAGKALNIAPYFVAIILAAAATSVPDTDLSVKDALKGNYDDAVANAVGSNIFDITVCLGLPLFAYSLWYGNVNLSSDASGASNVQELRIALVVITVLMLALFLFGKKIGKGKAVALGGLYILWTTFIVGRAYEWQWLDHVVNLVANIA